MATNIFKAEKDALCFLALMAKMFKNFDDQFIAPDGEKTHTKGLNIHALLIDNGTGTVLGMQQNSIHAFNNPLLHAEQLTLKEAIEKKNQINPRDPNQTSVESYYRNYLFNDPSTYDALNAGSTIYTTLEPCPFCTSALLVSRVKRIVYIVPDSVYGNSFFTTWIAYYKKYDIHYEQMKIDFVKSDMIANAIEFLKRISEKTVTLKDIPSTLYFDYLKDELNLVSVYFNSLNEQNLITSDSERLRNANLLQDLRNKISMRND